MAKVLLRNITNGITEQKRCLAFTFKRPVTRASRKNPKFKSKMRNFGSAAEILMENMNQSQGKATIKNQERV